MKLVDMIKILKSVDTTKTPATLTDAYGSLISDFPFEIPPDLLRVIRVAFWTGATAHHMIAGDCIEAIAEEDEERALKIWKGLEGELKAYAMEAVEATQEQLISKAVEEGVIKPEAEA